MGDFLIYFCPLRCWEMNLGPYTCQTSALAPSYIPSVHYSSEQPRGQVHLTSKEVTQESNPVCSSLHRVKVCTVVTPAMGRDESELVKGTMSSASVASPDRQKVHGKTIPVDGRLGALPNSPGKG